MGGTIGSAVAPGMGANSRLAEQSGPIPGLELESLRRRDQEFEAARQFVRLASSAYQRAAQAPLTMPPHRAARMAATAAAQRYAPGLARWFGGRAAANGAARRGYKRSAPTGRCRMSRPTVWRAPYDQPVPDLNANSDSDDFYLNEREPWQSEYNPPGRSELEGESADGMNFETGILERTRRLFGSIAGAGEATLALTGGERDENRLTDILFYARHPEHEAGVSSEASSN